jgi:hypothetical protein
MADKRPIVMPREFSGKTSWAEYVRYFDKVAAVNQWKDDEKCLFLAVSLEGRAADVHEAIPDDKKKKFSSLCKAISAKLEPIERVDLHKTAFRARMRKDAEPIEALCHDIKVLVTQAYPNADVETQDELAREQFVAALTPQVLRQLVRQSCPRSLEAAATVALQQEVNLLCEAQHVAPIQPPNLVASVASSYPLEEVLKANMAAMTAMTEAMQKLLSQQSTTATSQPQDPASYRPQQRQRRDFICFFCHQHGHRQAQCPARINSTQPPQQPYGQVSGENRPNYWHGQIPVPQQQQQQQQQAPGNSQGPARW